MYNMGSMCKNLTKHSQLFTTHSITRSNRMDAYSKCLFLRGFQTHNKEVFMRKIDIKMPMKVTQLEEIQTVVNLHTKSVYCLFSQGFQTHHKEVFTRKITIEILAKVASTATQLEEIKWQLCRYHNGIYLVKNPLLALFFSPFIVRIQHKLQTQWVTKK